MPSPPGPSEAFVAPRSPHATGRHHPAAPGLASGGAGRSGAPARRAGARGAPGGGDGGGEWPQTRPGGFLTFFDGGLAMVMILGGWDKDIYTMKMILGIKRR